MVGGRIGIHVLGGADVWAERPALYAERMAAFLAVEDPDDRVRHLVTVPAGYPYPEAAVACLLRERPDVLLLVATEQDRSGDDDRRPPDTVELGRRLRDALTRDPRAFGLDRAPEAELVVAGAVSLDAFRKPLTERLLAHAPAEVLMALTGGATVAFAAALLAALETNRIPRVVSQSHGPRDVRARTDLTRWLARHRRYAALAEADERHGDLWRALAAWHDLDWAALRESRAAPGEVQVRKTRIAVPAPPPASAGRAEEPPDRDWPYYADAIEASMLARFGRGDLASGLHLVRPWLESGIRARLRGDPAAAVVRRRMRGPLPGWLSDLVAGPAALPDGEVRRFLSRTGTTRLLTLARDADHGGVPAELAGDAAVLLRRLAAERTEEAPFDGDDRLVVMCVGLQTERTRWIATALRELAAAGDWRAESTHLRLVFSDDEGSRAAASALRAQIAEAGVAPAGQIDSIGPVADRDHVLAHTTCAQALRDAVLHRAIGQVWFVIGPGRTEMNLGALLATAEWAVEQGAPMRAGQLAARLPEGSEVRVSARPVIARLAQDGKIASLAHVALRTLDLDLARRMLELGSLDWVPLARDVGGLRELLLGRQPRPAARALLERAGAAQPPERDWRRALFSSRAGLVATAAAADPWRALYLVCAIAEGMEDGDGWRRPESSGAWLWRHRNQGPFGHRAWAVAPDRDQIAGHIRDLAMEHRDLACTSVVPPGTLVGVLKRLRADIDAVAERIRLRTPAALS